MKRRAVIVGVGHTDFGKLEGRTAWHLEAEAAAAAVADAGLGPSDVDGLLTDPGPTQGILDGITPHFLRLGAQLGLEIPGAAIGQLADGRVAHARDDRALAHAGPAGIRRLAMISRMTSLVPAPIPQFCTPREQRAT